MYYSNETKCWIHRIFNHRIENNISIIPSPSGHLICFLPFSSHVTCPPGITSLKIWPVKSLQDFPTKFELIQQKSYPHCTPFCLPLASHSHSETIKWYFPIYLDIDFFYYSIIRYSVILYSFLVFYHLLGIQLIFCLSLRILPRFPWSSQKELHL